MTVFNWAMRVPFRYQNNYVTLRELETWLLVHHDPEYVRRLLAWLHFKNGKVGVGGGWRAGGAQPDKPGFAPEGKSFHQNQEFATGFTGAAAVDVVYEDGPDAGDWHDPINWNEVPIQGSAESRRWGIHANVGVPGNGESWHIQWCDANLPGGYDLDGWQRWWSAGRPGPIPNYPLPPEHDPYRTPPPEPLEDSMHVLDQPQRLIDTRTAGLTRFKAGESRDIIVSPDDSLESVIVNITVVDPSGPGYLTAFGGKNWGERPTASNLNWNDEGGAYANLAVVPVHNDHIHIFCRVACHLVVDLQAINRKPTD